MDGVQGCTTFSCGLWCTTISDPSIDLNLTILCCTFHIVTLLFRQLTTICCCRKPPPAMMFHFFLLIPHASPHPCLPRCLLSTISGNEFQISPHFTDLTTIIATTSAQGTTTMTATLCLQLLRQPLTRDDEIFERGTEDVSEKRRRS